MKIKISYIIYLLLILLIICICSYNLGMDIGKSDLSNTLARQIPSALEMCIKDDNSKEKFEILKQKTKNPNNIRQFDKVLKSLE